MFVVKPRHRVSQKSQADESEAVNREAADQDSRGVVHIKGVQFHWPPKCHHRLRLINKRVNSLNYKIPIASRDTEITEQKHMKIACHKNYGNNVY